MTEAGHEVLREGRLLRNSYLAFHLHLMNPSERVSLGSLVSMLEHLVEEAGQ